MKHDLFKNLREFEESARKATESTRWLSDIAETVSHPLIADQLGLAASFTDHYPGLSQLGLAQSALDRGMFQEQARLAREVELLCEPYRSAQALIDSYDRSLAGLMGTNFSELLQTERYAHNIASAMQTALIPALEAQRVDITGMSSALMAAASAIDTSWMRIQPAWMVKASELLAIDTSGVECSGLTALIALEQETSCILAETDQITSVAAQIASITSAYSGIADRWKEIIAPYALLDGLEDIAYRQHFEIQKAGEVSEWRLGLLDSASRFVDRQVTWTGELISGLQDQIEDDGEEIEDIDEISAVSLIPQYIGYTKRANVKTTPEEGLEKSSIVEVTEKGKRIVENAVTINELAASAGRKQIFKYTGKMMIVSSNIGSLFCSSREHFGTMIDGFYMMFYENLEHIKGLSSDEAIRNEEVYQCIFRVKDMRTGLRHDFEHGKNVDKKRRDITECYRHYTSKPALVQQRDYVTLQRRMYDEFLALEEHLIGLLCAGN